MNPDDLIKAAPTIAQGATTLAAAVPFTSIVKRMLGPAADEVAEMWRDQIRVYRYGRQLKLLEKAERMAKEAGFTPLAVPPKILFPLLEGASFEDDEDLHTMWAALLANAASPENAGKVRPGFIASLRQMAPDEAALLNTLADLTKEYDLIFQNTSAATKFELDKKIEQKMELLVTRLRATFKSLPCETEADASERFETCLNVLSNAGLIDGAGDMSIVNSFGRAFLDCCRPPKSRS